PMAGRGVVLALGSHPGCLGRAPARRLSQLRVGNLGTGGGRQAVRPRGPGLEAPMSSAADVLRTGDAPLDAIAPALRALWRSLSRGAPADGPPRITRVSTMKPVVPAGPEPDAEPAPELSGRPPERHPARVILVRSRSGPKKVSAHISTLCHPSDGGRQLCSEQIQLVTAG